MADKRDDKIGEPIPLPPKKHNGCARRIAWHYEVGKDYRGLLRATVTEYIVEDTETPGISFKCHSIGVGGIGPDVGGWHRDLARVPAKPITQKKVDAMHTAYLATATREVEARRTWLTTEAGKIAIDRRLGEGI